METLFLQFGGMGLAMYVFWEILKMQSKRMSENDERLIKFVSDHNDGVSEIMKNATKSMENSTEVMEEAVRTMKAHNQVTEKLYELIKNK